MVVVKEVNAIVLDDYYVVKSNQKQYDRSFPAFLTLKITNHKKGLFKERCNRSGKIFTRRNGSRFVPDHW